ncbi:MAG: YesL family protein [Clostridia bacterium]|nr:YesL family protein [Clostridia bacterium]
MAGFFGMFDASKPGPGVSKNEPKKKRFFLFWELYFRKFFRLIIANLLYALVSIPVVTRGLAEAGLAFVTRNYAREKHVFLPSDFFDTIKKNWKQALAAGILELAISACLIFDIIYAWDWLNAVQGAQFMPLLFFAVSFFLVVIFCYARYYLYMQIITFKLSFKQVCKNSLLLAIAGFKENLIISLALLAIYALAAVLLFNYFWYVLAPLVILYVLLFPAFRSFLIQFTIFPLIKRTIIDPYYKEHPEEDLDKRHDLNLDVEESPKTVLEDGEQAEDPDVIFTDVGKEELPEETIPKQYSAEEMRKGRRLQKNTKDSDDDGTI